jgi:GcrA cell cycle regulator
MRRLFYLPAAGERMSNRLGHKYTDEEKQFIKDNTSYSASQISEMFFEKFGINVTRNAVIGIVHRAGERLKGRKSDGSLIKPKRRQVRPPSVNWTNSKKSIANVPAERLAPKSTSTEVIDPARPPLHVSFMELNSSNCHWPFGADNFTYCGHPAKPGKSYCAAHVKAGRGNYVFNPDGRRKKR